MDRGQGAGPAAGLREIFPLTWEIIPQPDKDRDSEGPGESNLEIILE
jgi:hypothetical protein